MRSIEIFPVMNGFVVKAGCQCIAYTDIAKAKRDLCSYLDNPDKAEALLIARFKPNLGPPGAPQPAEAPPERLTNALRG